MANPLAAARGLRTFSIFVYLLMSFVLDIILLNIEYHPTAGQGALGVADPLRHLRLARLGLAPAWPHVGVVAAHRPGPGSVCAAVGGRGRGASPFPSPVGRGAGAGAGAGRTARPRPRTDVAAVIPVAGS